MTRTARLVATAVVAVALPLVAGGPVQASDEDTIRTGRCSGSTDWKVKAKPDDGRIEVEAEIDSNRNGQTWRWVLRHNGSRSARGSSQTVGPSGSFSIERRTVNAAGTDRFTFRAVNNRSGEVCVGRVRI